MFKELVNTITVDQVRQELKIYATEQNGLREYLNTIAFKNSVLFFSNTKRMSVNEIVQEFKRMNGIK